MLKKNKVVFGITSLIVAVLVITTVSLFAVNQSRPKEIPQHLMTTSRAMEKGAYQLVSMDSVRTMERLMRSDDQLVKVKYISQYERTIYFDLSGNVIDSLPENPFTSNGKRLYDESTNIIWKMRVEEVLHGTLAVGDEIEVIIPIIDTYLPTVDDSNGMIMGLSNGIGRDSNKYYSGLISVFYVEDGRIYLAYDIEDFTKEYQGMKENQFKKKIKQFI